MSTSLPRQAFAAFLLSLLTACGTVGPDYRVPDEAAIAKPSAAAPFAGAAEAPYSAAPLPPHWWRLYRDPALDRLVEQALAANADLRAAAANLRRARALEQEVAAAGRPALGISAAPAYGRPSAAARGLPDALPDAASYDAGVSVSYQVDLFGKIARAIEAADADSGAAAAAYDLSRINVAAGTVRAYVDVCASAAQIGVAQRSLGLQQDFLDLTARRIAAGRGTALDASRAQAQAEQLRAALPPLQAAQRGALLRLAALLGETPGKLPESAGRCAAPPRLAFPVPVGDGAALLRRRPDIRQAERGLAAASARIGVATADLYPGITLGLPAGSTGALAGFGAGNALRWSLGSLISWSLPVNGAARRRIAQAEASSEAALARFDGTVLNALREAETTLTVYARELDRNAALKAAREQSALAASQASELYRYGRTDFLTTLDAQRSLASAESALTASDAQLASDQVALFLALGGGWESADAQATADSSNHIETRK
ncbi:TolC family protein [Noviherbaspirillum sp. L7-7A]|uniref:efflux transporter outer membrane subunit n=1 Tax=Noviherbaspirillum sp. L7-7A TaxID=2850560 RepID=UPI001C2C7D3B|nr:TolC family protein [Noviherbaspirillum sp. L7-7A]MBV0881651.1 TolC family protein [Noviherbaspirillum sp. L7-7A]